MCRIKNRSILLEIHTRVLDDVYKTMALVACQNYNSLSLGLVA